MNHAKLILGYFAFFMCDVALMGGRVVRDLLEENAANFMGVSLFFSRGFEVSLRGGFGEI
jgi:hypothetical protein